MTVKFNEGEVTKKHCPECESEFLVIRTNKENGTQFLGCPNFPQCKHTEPIPEEWIMRASGQPELPL